MKKFITLIICILLLLSASACTTLDEKQDQNSSTTNIENSRTLIRALTGSDNISRIESLSVINNDDFAETKITDSNDWEFLGNYFLTEVITFAQKEKLITSKTNLLRFGFSEESIIYLLDDGSIIKQEMCGDSGVPQEDRNFEIYKAEEKYMLNEEKLITLLKKYDNSITDME